MMQGADRFAELNSSTTALSPDPGSRKENTFITQRNREKQRGSVCVRERDREIWRDRDRGTERERQRNREIERETERRRERQRERNKEREIKNSKV